jgi:hypothetical protein
MLTAMTEVYFVTDFTDVNLKAARKGLRARIRIRLTRYRPSWAVMNTGLSINSQCFI